MGGKIRLISREDYIRASQEAPDHGMFRYPHGISDTERRRMRERLEGWTFRNTAAAKAAAEEYDKLFAAGEVRPPTLTEQTVMMARGHPDNANVQACRRLCEKRGIDWENYTLPEGNG